ncbi:MAG: hypothetical protein DRO67_07680, partial [Candidatus Asgardarchaeum californiense]
TIRRCSRIYLSYANKSKVEMVRKSLGQYVQIVNYFITFFWSSSDREKYFKTKYISKKIYQRGVDRFNITAVLSLIAADQALKIIKSQRKKSKNQQKMPRFRKRAMTLSCQLFSIINYKEGSFDFLIKFRGGLPRVVIPFNRTKHMNNLEERGFRLKESVIKLGFDNKKRLYIDLIYEKEKLSIKEEGETIGIDTGFRHLVATSRGELYGKEVAEKLKHVDKRKKRLHAWVDNEIGRIINRLDFSNIKVVVVENLKRVKHKTRGKFSRFSNRLLSFWHYAKVLQRLRHRCEEEGVLLLFKSPWKTSQRCPLCGNIDKRNRRADRFVCSNCGFEEDADIVGAMNLEALGLAGVYCLRSLPSSTIEATK